MAVLGRGGQTAFRLYYHNAEIKRGDTHYQAGVLINYYHAVRAYLRMRRPQRELFFNARPIRPTTH